MSAGSRTPSLHILVLTDRDWMHPQGGGTGTNLYGQVARWLAWGHRVTVIAGSFPGAPAVQRPAERLEIRRMGTRLTVFPRAAWAVARGAGRDADVVLEVVNGIAFFSPLWFFLRAPRVALVHHVHQRHYVTELGRRGRVAALLLEKLPLSVLYRHLPFLTISGAAREDLVALGVPREQIHVAYLGVEPAAFRPGVRAEQPTLLYLGRLKQYKRIEVVLDVLEAIPEARLEIAGDGDHRPALEAEIARRGLGDRVTLHGFVNEEEKAEVYGRAWVSLTASSAEGWCLTVMEAAACGTPSAALRIGGLPESIVDGRTGLLADTPQELAVAVRGLIADPALRDRLGAAAQARARDFTWEATAQANLDVLERAARSPRPRLRAALMRSESGKAAALAGATLANNAIQLVFVVVITRLLGFTDYGALAALVSAFLILLVGGQSIQVAAAREAALGRLGGGAQLRTTLTRWTRQLVLVTALLAVAGALLRTPLAALIGTPEHPWAAAAIPPTGGLWFLLSLQRGALQGLRGYGAVGISIVLEAVGRLTGSVILVLAGAGVTGAFLGTPLSFAVIAAGLAVTLHRRLVHDEAAAGGSAPGGAAPAVATLRGLVGNGWVPILGLVLLAVLQNVDVIIVKREIGGDAAGAYAAAAVAAKTVVWVAIGIGLHLLPEATGRAAAGLDPRPVLMRALAILAAVAVPVLLIFAVAGGPLLRAAFTAKAGQASGALVLLAAAMSLLAVAYLTVQYMLALGEVRFLWVLGLVVVVEPIVLTSGHFDLVPFAAIVLAVQCAAAAMVLALGLRARPHAARLGASAAVAP
jgi:glycosyltransferase involved in cell wall biosynthesis/O-antigen/teichoic acid export membrane protein